MGFRMKLILIFLLIPFTTYGLTVSEWVEKYNRPCSKVKTNQVCKGRLTKSLAKMKDSITVKMLKDSGLPLFLATVPIIESDYNDNAVSSAGARGRWQIMPHVMQTLLTTNTLTFRSKIYAGKIKLVEVRVIHIPTIEECKKLAKDPVIATYVAIKLLKELYNKYHNWSDALMAYNAGTKRLNKYLKGDPKPLAFQTRNYFRQVLAIQEYIKELE